MNKALILVVLLITAQLAIAGGIVTNTNQSAQFIRTMSRNASTDIDATYFNPAGLTQLSNGWHFSLHNQTIFQTKTVDNSFPLLNNSEYVGKVSAPIFPNFYAVYKKNKLALSFGFGPNGGGGSADFATGLPAFEIPVSALPALVPSLFNVTGYKADINFSGSSVYYGFQGNASYAINDMISVAAGGRYIYAVNTYQGAIENIKINPKFGAAFDGSYILAYDFFTTLHKTAEATMVSDKFVDATQTGSAMTPILGVNLKPMSKLDIGVKYEFNTALELTNDTATDSTGLFPDGATSRNDIPAILSLGAAYAVTPALNATVSYTYYFDKNATWDYTEDKVDENGNPVLDENGNAIMIKKNKADLVDKNFFEIAGALECNITDGFLVSLGFVRSTTGVTPDYQSDISHSLSSKTIAGGAAIKLGGSMVLQLGASYTMYDQAQKDITDANFGPYVETYNRSTLAMAIGLDYHL